MGVWELESTWVIAEWLFNVKLSYAVSVRHWVKFYVTLSDTVACGKEAKAVTLILFFNLFALPVTALKNCEGENATVVPLNPASNVSMSWKQNEIYITTQELL